MLQVFLADCTSLKFPTRFYPDYFINVNVNFVFARRTCISVRLGCTNCILFFCKKYFHDFIDYIDMSNG